MDYPGHVIKAGEQDRSVVKALKQQLNECLCFGGDTEARLDPNDPNFGPRMKQAVKLFQARNVDSEGRPLKQDGEVGSLTWEALFGSTSIPVNRITSDHLLARVLEIASAEEASRVRESPKYSNSGPRIDAYLHSVGIAPGNAWCCAFVYWCFNEAGKALDRENPMVKTAGCLEHWRLAPSHGARRLLKQHAVADPGLVKPGMILIMDHGRGFGHTGLVEKVVGGLITTVEGNTNASRTREGGGVYRLTRKILEINKGFIDYTGV